MSEKNLQFIILGGGCFWSIEAIFKEIRGIEEVVPGYAGGEMESPGYGDVTGGRTGHAEVVRVGFEEEKISLEEILEIFFAMHDPTTRNRQGNDVGTQYRSIILYTNPEQKGLVDGYIQKIRKDFENKIVTEVKPLEKFYKAEEYHENFYEKNSASFYCQVVISPKLNKLREKFKKKVL